jgi:HlyD family secretion protein
LRYYNKFSKNKVKKMALSRNKKLLIGGGIVGLLSLIIIGAVFANRKDSAEVAAVKLEKKKDLRSTVTASGEVRPIQYINVTSEVQGKIEDIYVKEGETVKKGQQLAKIDPTQLQTNQDAQLAAFQASRDDLQVTRSQVVAAQNQYSQSQQALNGSEAAVATAQQQVFSAQTQVEQARERVNSARQQIISSQTDIDRANVELTAANRELKRIAELVEQQVVAKIEYDQAKDRVANAEVSVRTAKANLETRKLAVNEALVGVNSAQSAVKESQNRVVESRSRATQQRVAVKDAARAVDSAGFSVRSGEQRSKQAEAFLRGQTSQRDKTIPIAQIDGIVAEIPAKVGTFAVAGLSTTALMTIADMSSVNIEVKIDETSIDKVEVGQPVKVKVDALGEDELEGEVFLKTPLALGKSQQGGGLSTNINTQEAKEFRVVVQLKGLPDGKRESLRPGMSATATITTKTVKDVIAVPIQSIVEKQPDEATAVPTPEGMKNNLPSTDKPKPTVGVFILDGNKAKFVEVETGIIGESDREITVGLSEGQEVITGPSKVLKTLKDGDIVKKQVKKEGEDAKKS